MKNVIFYKNLAKSITTVMKNHYDGHDHLHIERVVGLSHQILQHEFPSVNIMNAKFVEALALCHDILDRKVNVMSETSLRDLLEVFNIEDSTRIVDTCKAFGYSYIPTTILEKCVKDADMLDAIGAIGVARTFAYGGAHKIPYYDPNGESITEYFSGHDSASIINHFEEKLLKLGNRMYTSTGRLMAKPRIQFMGYFYDLFKSEVGESLC